MIKRTPSEMMLRTEKRRRTPSEIMLRTEIRKSHQAAS